MAIKAIEKVKLSKEDRRYLNNELAISKELFHINIIRCYEVIETKNYVYIVMERVPGGELFDLIERKKYFSEFESCYITYQIGRAHV